MSKGAVMQGVLLFFNELYRFLEFVCVYFATILGFCAIISIFVLGIIMMLRSTLLSKSVFGKAALWCLLIPVIFCGKLHAYFETHVGVRMFYWWYLLCSRRWVCVVYLVGMIILGAWIIVKRKRLMDSVNRLYDSEDHASAFAIKEFPGQVSSFCTGCLNPVIVIPEGMSGNEADIVIKHEETHIRLGHLWILFAYDILRVLLWPNLFLHLCTRYMKRDLEDICDTVTIQKNKMDVYEYGDTIIKCARSMMLARRKIGSGSGMSFAWDDGYEVLKKRLERIIDRKAYNTKALAAGIALVIAAVIATIGVIKEYSYKRTNDIGMISSVCYAGDLENIYTDLEQAVVTDFDDEYIYVDGKALLEKYPKALSENGWFYFAVGGYYKIPGIGGGGGWGEIDAKEIHEGIIKIKNHTEIDIWNRIIMWI
jgi:hypothetical protein